MGDLTTVTQPGGGVTHYSYDTDGEKLSSTNPIGAQTQATYDFLGRTLTSTQLVRQPTLTADITTNAYSDPAGFLSATTTPAGVTTSYGYDVAGEVTSVIDGAGNVTSYSYDALGRQVVTTLPDGSSAHVSYDEAGNQIGTADETAAGTVLKQTSGTFDGDGDLTSATDPLGDTTSYGYDALGLPTSEVQPVSATSAITTSFGYDPAGNLTRYTDGDGNATIYTYNSWNLPESMIVPATAANPGLPDRTFTTSYNADGEPVQVTSPGGVSVSATYDALGNLTSQAGTGAEAPTATRTFGYDAAGNLTSASTASGTDTFSYDDRGLLLSASGPSGSSSFGYNADGDLTSQTSPLGLTSYGYDRDGRLASLTDPATGTALSYSYNPESQLSSISYGSGGAVQSFGYNSLHELTSDTLTAPGGGTEASISYGYDADGNETSKTTTGFTGSAANTYTYDQANRLTSWNNGSTTVSYGYDADGNRTQVGSQTYSYDARDELISGGGSTYAYTPRGTLASVSTASGTTNSTFDAFGELVTQGSTQFSYDALGRLLSDQGAAFSYSGTSNDVTSDGSYDYSRDPSGGLIAVAAGLTPGGQPSQSVLAMTDQHSDVVGEFSQAGTTLAGSASYDPFGNVSASAGLLGDLGYQSGWTDPVSSDVKMGARWYNPATGQFLNRDTASNSPIPYSIAANTFDYGNDNPLTTTDPLGTCGGFFGCLGAAISSGVSTVTHAVTSAVTTVATAASNVAVGVSNLATSFGNYMAKASTALLNLAINTVHTITTVAQKVSDAFNSVKNTIVTTYNNVTHAVTTTVSKVVTATAHAVKYAVSTATQFVQNHAAAIASFAASTLVFMGCEAAVTALTAGTASLPGAVGCSALAGAVGNAVTYAVNTPPSKWSLGALASTALQGAAVGAASGFLGSLGSELLGPVVDAVASRLGPALVDDAADAAADAADSALDGAADGAADDASSALDDASTADNPSAGDSSPSDDSPPTDQSAAPDSGAGDEQPSGADESAVECGGESFSPGTKVLLATGRTVLISQLRPGQKVLAANPRTGLSQAEPVIAVLLHFDTDVYRLSVRSDAGVATITTTANHAFWDRTANRWVHAKSLRYGDRLRTRAGQVVTADGGRAPARSTGWMWDLTVRSLHTFYVLAGSTWVLVHNTDPTCPIDLGNGTFRHPDGSIRDANGHFAGTTGVQPGTTTEENAWDQLEADGATVVRQETGVNVPGFPLRKYDGLVLTPDGWYGIEVKGATAGLTPAQRAFDAWLSTPGNTAVTTSGYTLEGVLNVWIPKDPPVEVSPAEIEDFWSSFLGGGDG